MACFCGNTADLAALKVLPNIWCMPCTSAGSSTWCITCFRIGLPPSWHELVQEMGRVDRLQNAEPGSNRYNVYLNLNTYLSLWMRVQLLEPNLSVGDWQNDDILSVLRFTILPHECYHSVIESHFEDPTLSTPRDGCKNYCSYCTGAYKNFCGKSIKATFDFITTNGDFYLQSHLLHLSCFHDIITGQEKN